LTMSKKPGFKKAAVNQYVPMLIFFLILSAYCIGRAETNFQVVGWALGIGTIMAGILALILIKNYDEK